VGVLEISKVRKINREHLRDERSRGHMWTIQILLGIFGVLLAVFFQAWGLPIFIVTTLFFGWWVEKDKPIVRKSNDNIFVLQLIFLWLFLHVGVLVASSASKFTELVLLRWNDVSIWHIQIPVINYDEGAFGRLSITFMINLTALIVPVLISVNLPQIISPFPTRDFLKKRISYSVILVAMTSFSLWGLSQTGSSYSYLGVNGFNASLLNFYFFQSLLILLLFSNFKMESKTS
jgi:drug/metabolite transporter superfamily protein YnfA